MGVTGEPPVGEVGVPALGLSRVARAGVGAGWYEKDYTTYGYEFGTWKSRFDLFDAGLKRIEARVGQLIPPPVRKIPILIGGTGPKRTLPAVARYADIWHTFLSVEAFTEASAEPRSWLWPRTAPVTTSNARCTGSARPALRLTAPPAPPHSSSRSPPTPPPVTTSAPWRKCWPGVSVIGGGAVSTVTAAQETETRDLLQFAFELGPDGGYAAPKIQCATLPRARDRTPQQPPPPPTLWSYRRLSDGAPNTEFRHLVVLVYNGFRAQRSVMKRRAERTGGVATVEWGDVAISRAIFRLVTRT
jgi:hypothetical protein